MLLAGERRAERIPGFALGNSPLEMTREAVQDKTLVMATTTARQPSSPPPPDLSFSLDRLRTTPRPPRPLGRLSNSRGN